MTDLKRIVQVTIAAIVKAARAGRPAGQSAAASMHLATQGIDVTMIRRD